MNLYSRTEQDNVAAVNLWASVSVVIPSYESPHLNEVVKALRALEPKEVLVVDSSYEAPTISGVNLIHSNKRLNPSAARNLGAKKARGDILFFIDADVLLTRDIDSVIADFSKPNAANIMCGLYEMVSDDNFITRFQNAILRYRLHDAMAGTGKLWSSSHFLMRRDAFYLTGGFDETLESYEDMEFFMRCGAFGLEIDTKPVFLAHHLKKFGVSTILRDYSRKTRKALEVQTRYPLLFKGHRGGISLPLHISGVAGALVPLSVVCGMIMAIFGTPLSGNVLTVAAVMAVVSPAMFPGGAQPKKTIFHRIYSATVWALCYSAILFGAIEAVVRVAVRRISTLLCELFDFARLGVRVLFRTGLPVQVINYITSRCNLRCGHCFYKASLDDPDPGEIPRAELIKTMKEIGPVLWYSFAGGEPFIRQDLEELILDVQSICRPKVLSFPTNGWYTEKTFAVVQRVLQRMRRGNLVLFFSLDGPQEVHDQIRGENSFDRLQSTIDRLRPLKKIHANLYISLVTTVTSVNAKIAPEFVHEIIREFKPDSLSINLYREHSLNSPKLPDDLIEAYSRSVDAYAEEVKKGHVGGYGFVGSKILRAKEFVQKDIIYRVAKFGEFVTPCTAGTLSYVIMEDGSIKPCEILSDTIGNIYPQSASFREIIRSSEAKTLRKWIKKTKCRCTYECANSTNALFSWPSVPKLIHRVFTE